MKSLFEALLRLYEFDGPEPQAAKPRTQAPLDKRLLDLSSKDSSTFPYLP